MYADKKALQRRQAKYKTGELRTIAFDVTSRCDMNCHKCYAATFVKAEPVDLESLGNAFDELHSLGVFHYVLQGGEPILDPERLEKIIKMIYPDETYINVVSNGWGMTVDKIRWLKSLKIDKIALSLDSGIEEEHDFGRLPGSYKKVITAVDNVLAEGLIASVSVVVTHDSLMSEGFKKVYEFAAAKKIRVDVQIAEPVGNWDGKREFLITPSDSAYIKKLHLNSQVLPNGQRIINRDIYCGEFNHCPAGVEFMSISVDGNFLPCNFLQFSLGNIKERFVKQMREELLRSEWFDGKHPICLCGEDPNFIDKFIIPYIGQKKPLCAQEIFNIEKEDYCEKIRRI